MLKKAPVTTTKTTARNRSTGSDFFIQKTGILSLADGTAWQGRMPAWQTDRYEGEVVFNTGMTGYVESLTDPSYAGQLLLFTYPLIGNYGVTLKSCESDAIQVSGVIMSEIAAASRPASADLSLIEWLHEHGVPALIGVDTRALTKHLRESGTMVGVLAREPVKVTHTTLPTKFVSIGEPVVYNQEHKKTVILVDCGAKENILRSLLQLPVRVKRVPYDYDYTDEPYDGVVISNGPGDPTDYQATIAIARKAMTGNKCIFGICLGNQIIALAAGAKTYKLKFGHRGHNQPCLEPGTNRAYITSQNHGYAVDERSLPKDWIVTFRNLNDNSVEGIAHRTKPFFSVQFHPEACPGPTDTAWLFNTFFAGL